MGDITLAQLIKQTGYPNAQKEGLTSFSSTDSDLDVSDLN